MDMGAREKTDARFVSSSVGVYRQFYVVELCQSG